MLYQLFEQPEQPVWAFEDDAGLLTFCDGGHSRLTPLFWWQKPLIVIPVTGQAAGDQRCRARIWSGYDLNLVTPLMNSRSEEHTSELQSRGHHVCRLLLEQKNNTTATGA